MAVRTSWLIVAALLLTIGCGYESSPSAPSANGPAVTAMIVSGAARLGTSAYGPNPLEIPAGTTVTWINHDSTIHTSTSNTGAWASPALAPDAQFSVTFQSRGTFTYRCAIHPNMIGTINVQ